MHWCVLSLLRLTVLLLIALSAASCSSQSICTTDSCKHEAENMLSKIDDTVRICDDFFQFACGRYEPEIPNHKTKIDELSLIQDTLQERLNEIMSADIIPSEIEPFKKVKTFYQNCMDKCEKNKFWKFKIIWSIFFNSRGRNARLATNRGDFVELFRWLAGHSQ